MRQLGSPTAVYLEMTRIICDVFEAHGIKTIDANQSTGRMDYLERILGLIRSTGFTVAVFSHETRPNALANITLELGFAAMCGKPLVIAKSEQAMAPSDLTRTDWLSYDPTDEDQFRVKLHQAV